jgi:predicted PurR-regulated permease PerM
LVTGHSVSQTLVMTAILFGISAIENYVLTPKLVGNRLNLNALTCFIGLFAGGLLWGIWGMFLSIPILGVVRIVFAAIPALEGWGELLSDKLDTSPSELIRKPKASQAV